MQAETRRTLKLLTEKAALLQVQSFWGFLREGREVCISFETDRRTGAVTGGSYSGPDEESEYTLLMTLRLFLQPKDYVSFARLAEVSREDRALSPEWRAGLAQHQAELRSVLDERLQDLAPEFGEPVLTRGQVFKTHLYGGIAHLDQRMLRRLRRWQAAPAYPLLRFTFGATAADILCVVLNTAELARAELARDPP